LRNAADGGNVTDGGNAAVGIPYSAAAFLVRRLQNPLPHSRKRCLWRRAGQARRPHPHL